MFEVKALCRFLGLAASTYYYHRGAKTPVDRYAHVRPVLREVFDRSYRSYGYRRVRIVLAGKHGMNLSGKTVLRLMREEQRLCQVRRRKYRSYRGEQGRIAPNILARDFTTNQASCKWVTDITEFTINGNKLYLSPVIDLFNREVISYGLQPSPTLPLVTDMLTKAGSTYRPTMRWSCIQIKAGITSTGHTANNSRPWGSPSPCHAKATAWTTPSPRISSVISKKNSYASTNSPAPGTSPQN
ncbi:MAG: IS3 family transposase [Xanthomonadales bacterium]|nr:IS3 family transposase [Xanthomonadales bacterium]